MRQNRSTITALFPVIPTGAGRLLLRTVSVRGLHSGGTVVICQPNPARRDTTDQRSPRCFSPVIPTAAGRRFLRTVSVRGLRSGGTVAIRQPNPARRDTTDQRSARLFPHLPIPNISRIFPR